MNEKGTKRFRIDHDGLPDKFPTHEYESIFWESLGRAIATFGFLEHVLKKAIFVITGTQSFEEDKIEQEFKKWVEKLETTLHDPLGKLIDDYESEMQKHPDVEIAKFDVLLDELRKAKQIRDILCHSSWQKPDISGATTPYFLNRKNQKVSTAMDREFIDQVQQKTTNLACEVINSVTQMGWQFPGIPGP